MDENSPVPVANSNVLGALNEFTTEVVITVIHESSEEEKSFDTVFQQSPIEDSGLQLLLKELCLEEYSEVLNKAGFWSVCDLTTKMQNSSLTVKWLQSIGISKPGHARRLLARLEPTFLYLFSEKNEQFCCAKPPRHEMSIKEWLCEMKLGYLEKKFLDSGYESLFFLLEVMKTKHALTETELKEEIGIDKPGYRVRILGKLHLELSRRWEIDLDRQTDNHSCNQCLIF